MKLGERTKSYPDWMCESQLIYIGQTTNLAERMVNHHRHLDAFMLDPFYTIHFCPIDIAGSKRKIESVLEPEEKYLIKKHNPLLNNRTKFSEICKEALEKYSWRIGIMTDYRRDESGDVELDNGYIRCCDQELEPEPDPYDA